MKVGGYNREIDLERLGPTLMISASIILAIRTAKRPPEYSENLSNRDWEAELDFAVKIASRLLDAATRRKPEFFRHKDIAWHMPTDEDTVP